MNVLKEESIKNIHEHAGKIAVIADDISILWDKIYEEHKKVAIDLFGDCYNVHLSLHQFMKEIFIDCDKNIAFFNKIILEFKIAKENQVFDTTFTKELKKNTTKILEDIETKELIGIKIQKEIIDCKEKVEVEKQIMSENIRKKYNLLCHSIKPSVSTGMSVALASVATVGISDAVLIGVATSAAVLVGIEALSSILQKHNLKKLANLMQTLITAMDNLRNYADEFQQDIISMARDIRNYSGLIDQCIDYSSVSGKPEILNSNRVIQTSDHMIQEAEKLIAIFTSIRNRSEIPDSGLRKLILRHNPRAFLKDE